MVAHRWLSKFLLFALLFQVSCSSRGAVGVPSPTASHSATPLPPSSTASPTSRPTQTQSPSRAPTLTFPPTLTPIPLSFPSPEGNWKEYSPDLKWGVWEVLFGTCGTQLIIQNLSDETLGWELSDQVTFKGEIIDLMVVPFHWSVDGRFLYFATHIGCMDGGPPYPGVRSLKRLTLTSGQIINMMPLGENIFEEIVPEFSSDSKYLAYLDGYKLTIRNLTTWEERSITIELPILEENETSLSTGGIVWSPDNAKLVYWVWTGNDYYGDFSLIFVNAISMESKLLIEDFAQSDGPIEWLNDEEIKVTAWQAEKDGEITLIINTSTGEITEAD